MLALPQRPETTHKLYKILNLNADISETMYVCRPHNHLLRSWVGGALLSRFFACTSSSPL